MPAFRASSATALMASALALAVLAGGPALAQQDPGFFIPNQQGGQRPAQQQPRPAQQQRPAQQPQRPSTQAPQPLPPGQQPPDAVIGIVDVPEIQRVSTAFNQVRDEIERRRQRLNDDLQREQNNWREQQQQLANQRASLPPDQLRERERTLQDRITDSQRIFRERSRAIEQAAQQALAEIEQALGGVIRQVAASRKVNLVLPRPLVIFNDPPFDLTEEVAQQFNRVLRSVTMPPEATSGEQPAATAPAARPATPPAAQQQRR
ncbi:OmpH family outer membrane protein [Belnapia rosea]|uniref:Periplasmic chaperone for outer membrane proteins Skp n=1 Tax=Belnapia rosea TaxID=938405 RepID=A0A1G6M025_9PROT|nr:OmpH family outer membrane protein [Belnapia rosea]SDB45108.1 periplasmic chaperone for outer membrane proteins Skp [Belnapia rosea]SDC48872.1 periplasmic chaperone for outer membrane proteins Skp [Belnapia rosea]